MSNNRNFNNNFRGSNFTFRYDFPPPPLPPPILPPMRPPFFAPPPIFTQPVINNNQIREKNDEAFIRWFGSQIPPEPKKYKPKATTITRIREEIQCLVTILKDFDGKLSCLKDNIDRYPESEWKRNMDEMNDTRKKITEKVEEFVKSYMDVSRKLLAKRTAKRLRLKRLKEERKLAKKERMKQLEERSRKIDENLQKIKDDILKAHKAEEAKLEADVVLREVRRRKLDARRSLSQLDALLRLRRARLASARGRGQTVAEREASTFTNNIEKLKSLWNLKLLAYEKEEIELQAKLAEDSVGADTDLGTSQMGVESSLAQWQEILFGSENATPQVDFHGDLHRFITVRSQWDQYIDEQGSPLPVGWVVPPLEQED